MNYTNWKLGDLCECGHPIEDHYALNKMPCTKCGCMEIKKMWAVYYEVETACGYPDGGPIASFDNQSDAERFMDELIENEDDYATFYVSTNGPLAMLVAFPYCIYISWRAAEDVYRMTLTLKGYN